MSSKKGIEGIDLISKNPPFIYKNKKDLIKIIYDVIYGYKKIKKNSVNSKKYYLEKYSMKNVIKKFINENKI